jgi:hypothetical protein
MSVYVPDSQKAIFQDAIEKNSGSLPTAKVVKDACDRLEGEGKVERTESGKKQKEEDDLKTIERKDEQRKVDRLVKSVKVKGKEFAQKIMSALTDFVEEEPESKKEQA